MISVFGLGTARIETAAGVITPPSPRKFALLLRLAAEPGRRVARATLAECIFSGLEASNGMHSLRELVYQTRKSGVEIQSDRASVWLEASDVELDFTEIRDGVPISDEQLQAIARGFLPGVEGLDSDNFGEWLDSLRGRVEFSLCRRLIGEANEAKARGQWRRTELAARACLALDPVNEAAVLALAEMLTIGGAKAKAVGLLDRYLDDVGVDKPDLRVQAKMLRRRVSERLAHSHQSAPQSPFVGREDEMAALRAAFTRTRNGEANAVVFCGDPGIGKSRLVAEFTELASLEGAQVVKVTLQARDAHRSLGAFVEAGSVLVGCRGALGCSPESLALITRLTGGGSDAGQHSSENPEELFHRVIDALTDLAGAVASETPLVLVIEDAHYMDPSSRQVLAAVLAGSRTTRLLVLVTTRESKELMRSLRHTPSASVVLVNPLDDTAVQNLVDNSLAVAVRGAAPQVRESIVELSGGNPLFALSLVASCREAGDQFEIPSNVRESLRRRLDGLGHREIGVLATCIALGRHASASRLAACLELPHIDALESIGDLSERGVLREADGVFQTAHPLIGEVADEKIPGAVRRLTAQRVGVVLGAEAERTNSTSLRWAAADCYLTAGDEPAAFNNLRLCAVHAMNIGQPADAANNLRRACALDVPRNWLIGALEELVHAADAAIQSDVVIESANRLRSLGRLDRHDDIEIAEIKTHLQQAGGNSSHEDKILRCLSDEVGSVEHRIKAALRLIKYADVSGNSLLAERAHEEFSKYSKSEIDIMLQLEFDLVYASATKQPERASEAAELLLQYASKLPAIDRARHSSNAGVALHRANRPEAAITAYTEAYNALDSAPRTQLRVMAATQLASIHDDLGNVREADAWLEAAIRAAGLLGDVSTDLRLLTVRLEIALGRGDLELTRRLVQESEMSDAHWPGAIQQRWKRAIQLRIDSTRDNLDNSRLSAARELISLEGPSMGGLRDFEVGCGCSILLLASRAVEAHDSLEHYLQFERTHAGPLTRHLAVLRSELEAAVRDTSMNFAV